MAFLHILRVLRSMPPHLAALRAARFAGRTLRTAMIGRLLRKQSTYPPVWQVTEPLARHVAAIDPGTLAPIADWLRERARAARANSFDLLGSGPVRVERGQAYAGFGGHRHGRPARRSSNWRADILDEMWPGNRGRAGAILGMIDDPAYAPVDWQADFRSGHRWSLRSWGGAIAYGHKPGVDVKVPWELARLQHLPQLALAYALDRDPAVARLVRNRILDFLGANPPGWGVNWACAMDVAIRAVNLILARDLLLAAGAQLDEGFEDEFGAALLAHGRHVAANLEWTGDHRGNHYLADIVGLAFIAATLPRSDETDLWLALATRELAAELPRQFLPDGANFEASTAYHRLSAEMALWGVALILGLPPERRQALADYDHRLWRRTPPLAPAPVPWPPFPAEALRRLAAAARFAADVTKPSGTFVQIGDNDSGRLLALSPWTPLDAGHLVAAAKGLFGLDLPSPAASAIETALVAALAKGRLDAAPEPATSLAVPTVEDGVAERAVRVVLRPPDPAALAGLVTVAYPDFGLFLWRGPRAFVSVRCGPIGQNGQGGHAHNDQLAVEIEIDGVAYARDPGTFVYTADLGARNRWRSALAHFVPRDGDAEPARMLTPFRLEDRAQARALGFGPDGFLGRHQGFAQPVWRRVAVADGRVVVEDMWGGSRIGPGTELIEHEVASPRDLAESWGLSVPFSPGYGLVETP